MTPNTAADPVSQWPAVTTGDTAAANFAKLPRGLYVVTSGTIAIVDDLGNVLTRTCTAGEILSFRPVRVNTTGTTATLRALY